MLLKELLAYELDRVSNTSDQGYCTQKVLSGIEDVHDMVYKTCINVHGPGEFVTSVNVP